MDIVLDHLMFHKAIIDEGTGSEKIDRYLGLLRSGRGETADGPVGPARPLGAAGVRAGALQQLDPWDVNLMEFARLYTKKMHAEEVNFIVAGKLMHMAWSILHMQSQEVLLLHERPCSELFCADWDMDAMDQFVERPPARYRHRRPGERGADRGRPAPQHPAGIAHRAAGRLRRRQAGSGDAASNRQKVREQLLKVQEKFDDKAHNEDQEKDVAETWDRIMRCGNGPIALEDLFEGDKEDCIMVFVSLLFLARSGKIALWQDDLPYGQIFLEIKLPWDIGPLVDGQAGRCAGGPGADGDVRWRRQRCEAVLFAASQPLRAR